MTRERRLQSVASTDFLKTLQTKNYARRYGVDLLCSIVELRMLGMAITPEYEEAVKKSSAARIEQKRKKREKKTLFEDIDFDSDETFAYIAGYTAGGAPHGTTWAELEAEEQNTNWEGV